MPSYQVWQRARPLTWHDWKRLPRGRRIEHPGCRADTPSQLRPRGHDTNRDTNLGALLWTTMDGLAEIRLKIRA
jgi:hypothetical protein